MTVEYVHNSHSSDTFCELVHRGGGKAECCVAIRKSCPSGKLGCRSVAVRRFGQVGRRA